MNKVILIGNIVRDIELKYAPSGTAIATTGIATNRKWKDQSGQQKEEVCFVDLTFFGKTAEIANQYLQKGKKVAIEGRLKLDQWQDQNGNNRSKHSIIVESLEMLGSKQDQSNQGQQQDQSNQAPQQQYKQPPKVEVKPATQGGYTQQDIDIDEDEIPF